MCEHKDEGHIPLFLIWLADHFFDTWNENLAVYIHKRVHESNKIRHRFMDCTSKNTRMQVSSRSGDIEPVVNNAP